ncbi:MAG: cytochrome c biogenesis protein CcsA [Planctomycetaceae bacterium]|jgi:ABC-type transport system involved in cytochrome c biogenesis permease subunit|nr:cytochrome c biogenesis protein CcsA [Planctomycetaceae bacterium]
MFPRILLIITICLAIFQYSSTGFAQSGRVWGTTPVFDGGRVMPLNSFSKRLVKEICGTSRPFLVRDDTILTELNRVIESQPHRRNNQDNIDSSLSSEKQEAYRFLIRGNDLLGDFDTGLSGSHEAVSEQTVTETLAIHGMTSSQTELIYQRIRALLPPEGRYFDADELILSWLGEPEIWDYIPIFPAEESDYRTEVLEVPLQNNTRTVLQRVAVFQLKQSQRFQQRLADIERRRMQRKSVEVPIRYDQITEQIAAAMTLYQELTFHPQRLRPTRMIDFLQQTIDFSAGQSSSYTFALESWGHLLELGEIPARQSIKPNLSGQENENELEHELHPTTQRWHEIVRNIRLLAGAFDRLNEYGEMVPPNLKAVEKHFELLLKIIDENFEESLMLMENVYPGVVLRHPTQKEKRNDNNHNNGNSNNSNNNSTDIATLLPLFNSPENKERNKEVMTRIVLNYYYAIKTLRREVESAYLALYDNGHSMRVLPVAALSALGDSSNVSPTVQPWGTMQMILFGGDDFIQRFFDADFHRETSPTSDPIPESVLQELAILQNIGTELAEIGKSKNKNKSKSKSTENAKTSVSDTKTSGENALDVGTFNSETETIPEEKSEETKEKQWEKELFTENESPYLFLSQTRSSATPPSAGDFIGRIRVDFISLMTAYSAGGRSRSINEVASIIQDSLRNSANRAESLREQLVDKDNALMSEYLRKTSYPQRGSMNTEYRYQRLAPFFWMWIFAAGAILFTGISLFLGKIRSEMIDDVALQKNLSENRKLPEKIILPSALNRTHSAEEFLFWLGIVLLGLSIFITFIGGVLRAWITGWAPVTNMYETIVLMAFSASLFGLWYSLYPLIHPVIQLAWRSSSLPDWRRLSSIFRRDRQKLVSGQNSNSVFQQAASDFGLPGGMPIGIKSQESFAPSTEERREQLNQTVLVWQLFLFVPRLILTVLTFLFVVNISYGVYAQEHGTVAAILELLKMNDFIDWLVVIASIALILWFVPQLILTTILVPIFLCRPSRIAAELGIVSRTENTPLLSASTGQGGINSVFQGETVVLGNTDRSGNLWLSSARSQILNRKLFVIVAASITLLAGLASYFNTAEFNPDIKPIVALLRSNFWLTVHVIAIVVSYAAALVAWGMAVVGLGDAIFGRYRYIDILSEPSSNLSANSLPTTSAKTSQVCLPVICDMFAPIIHRLLQSALVLLILGTVLGARWADYSWGRFWSWDPKEVWALITIFFYVIVLHGRIAQFYGRIGVMIGALFASIAVIMTWYGINFVFKGSLHSYGGGAVSNATFFLGMFVILNILWGFLAIFRYSAEMYGHETES